MFGPYYRPVLAPVQVKRIKDLDIQSQAALHEYAVAIKTGNLKFAYGIVEANPDLEAYYPIAARELA